MRRMLFGIGCAAAFCSAPALAAAQNEPPAEAMPGGEAQPSCPPGTAPVYQPPPSAPVEQPPPAAEAPRPVAKRPVFSPSNQSLTVGGGVSNFARSRISDENGAVGGAWDVRYLLGVRSHFAFEAGYIGTAAGGGDSLVTDNVYTQALTGSARFNVTRSRVQPYVTAGVGWANLHRNFVTPSGNTADSLSHVTNSVDLPFAGGIAGYIGKHGVVDMRGGYDLITNKSFTDTGARPDMWSAELRLGYAF